MAAIRTLQNILQASAYAIAHGAPAYPEIGSLKGRSRNQPAIGSFHSSLSLSVLLVCWLWCGGGNVLAIEGEVSARYFVEYPKSFPERPPVGFVYPLDPDKFRVLRKSFCLRFHA